VNEQLPVISSFHNLTPTKTKSTSLLGRGLLAILDQKKEIAIDDQDKRYRQSRDIYNRITDYGEESRFKVELLPTQEELLKEPLLPQLKQLQPFYNLMKQLAGVFPVFQELANQGYGKAYFPLANMYRGGQGISVNIDKADYYSRMAFVWCFANQTLNDTEIWSDLGWMYQRGRSVEKDGKQAVFWFRKAAEQGDARAQYNLGRMYESGRGVEQDDEQAVFWYREAAEQGEQDAQNILGDWYHEGSSMAAPKDRKQAFYWYSKAAEQRYAVAQKNLGEYYYYGYGGVVQDYKKAAFWYEKAAEQGDASAQMHLEHITKLGINWKDA
jgi:uncharacterized protein